MIQFFNTLRYTFKFSEVLLLLLIFTGTDTLFSQSAHKLRLEGDKYFDKQDFSSAEIEYKKARQKESDFKSNFNIGNSLIRQSRPEEAIESYNSSLKATKDSMAMSKVYHNMGNAYYNMKDYEKSIDSYKKALRINPNDQGTRRNLALAKEMIVEKSQQENNNNKKDKDQNNNDNKDNKDQQNKENQQQQNKDKQQDSDQKKTKLSKSEMEKLLKNIETDENEIQKRVIKGKGKSEKREKDW